SWLGGEFGRRVAGSLLSIALVTIGALVVWEVVGGMIERRLNRTDETGAAVVQSQRVRTLLPLLRNALMIALIVIAGLIVLSEIGINIAPLLAGAGVVGLAIGFGAQTLVKDVITGLFILFENTIAVGDIVDVGGHSGVVESLSV